MKIALIFLILLSIAIVAESQPSIIAIGGGGSSDITSNGVYTMIQTYAPTNGGQTSAQVATQINDTNVNRIQPIVDSKLAITNQYVKTNASGQHVYGLIIDSIGSDTGLSISSSGSPIFDVDLEAGFIEFVNTGTPRVWQFDNAMTIAGLFSSPKLYIGVNDVIDATNIFQIDISNTKTKTFQISTNGELFGNGIGLTNLQHSSTVSAGSGATVTPSQNPDGSTNFQVSSTGSGNGFPLSADGDANNHAITNLSLLTASQANFNVLWATNVVTPTNSFAGTVVDLNKGSSSTNLSGDIIFSDVSNVVAGGDNTAIVHLYAGALARSITVANASMHTATNWISTLPAGWAMDVLVSVPDGRRTNFAQNIYP